VASIESYNHNNLIESIVYMIPSSITVVIAMRGEYLNAKEQKIPVVRELKVTSSCIPVARR
jgi:hypothetical protein